MNTTADFNEESELNEATFIGVSGILTLIWCLITTSGCVSSGVVMPLSVGLLVAPCLIFMRMLKFARDQMF